jgi:hypothetical protein
MSDPATGRMAFSPVAQSNSAHEPSIGKPLK